MIKSMPTRQTANFVPHPTPGAPSLSGTASLVRVFTAEDRAYAHALLEIEARRRVVADLQDQLADLTHGLNRFAAEAQIRFASVFAELDYVRRAIGLCERRIARLRGRPRPAPKPPEPEEEDWSTADAAFKSARSGGSIDLSEGAAAIAAEIKRIYLELARRYHPDLAQSDDERAGRQEMMLKVNQAFHERDLDTLVAIRRDALAADGPNGLLTVAARLSWSLRELDRLDGVIADLNTELATVRSSESGRLWRSFAAGEPVFDRLAVDLKTELNRQRTRLADLTDIQNAIAARTKRTARR